MAVIRQFPAPGHQIETMEQEDKTQKDGDSNLSERIYATRKARIHAEERLLRYGLLAKLALATYALSSVILGICACVLHVISGIPEMIYLGELRVGHPGDLAGWMSLLMATVLLPLSTLVSAQRFSERALLMRASYVHLTQLEGQVNRGKQEDDPLQKYCLILALSENHHEMDYQTYMIKHEQKILIRHRARIWLHWGSHVVWYALGVGLPIGIVIGFFCLVFTM